TLCYEGGTAEVHERTPHAARLRRYLRLVQRARGGGPNEDRVASGTNTKDGQTGCLDLETLISPPDAAISREVREEIRMVLNILTPREAEIVRMRFGIGESHDHLPEEIAKRLALSRQRISTIQVGALRKLRRRRNRHLQPVIRA